VLALVAEGKTNKEIGQALVLSEKTVKNYLSNIMEKLQVARRSQAAAYFVQHSGR
jgi:DNA-binding NarL/FixJ family response regulator